MTKHLLSKDPEMKRTPIVLFSTIAGVAGVLHFNPDSPSLDSRASSSATETTNTATAEPNVKTATGDSIFVEWGYVQLEVTSTDGKITKVSALQLPDGDRKSLEISQRVEPLLLEQAIAAQSANIAGISGATYTSVGYAQSLQSALDQLGL